MRALVTGATGFVGGALVEHLLANGVEVHAVVREPASAGELEAAGARVFQGDLGDPSSIAAAAASCDVAFHAAGIASYEASREVLGWVNVAGTENVLRAARHAGVRRLVHVSCADVTLTGAPRVGWDEDKAPVRPPADRHARSKLEAEELAIGLGGPGFETIVLRPAYVWGPGDRTNLPGLCREGLGGGIRLVGRGENLMATTYVGNLADAALRAARAEVAAGAVYLICDEELTLQGDFFASLSEAVGLPAPRPGAPYPLALASAYLRQLRGASGVSPTDVRRRGVTSSFKWSKARDELGYESPVTQAEGMRALAAWVQAEGGPAEVAKLARPVPLRDDIAKQVERADAAAREALR